MTKIYSCYDGGICRNEAAMEDLLQALEIARKALRQYRDGKTWQFIARDALVEIDKLIGKELEQAA